MHTHVTHVTGERCFHALYQLMLSRDNDALRAKLQLPSSLQEVRYLNQSGRYEIAGLSDANEWEETLSAMRSLDMSEDDISQVR